MIMMMMTTMQSLDAGQAASQGPGMAASPQMWSHSSRATRDYLSRKLRNLIDEAFLRHRHKYWGTEAQADIAKKMCVLNTNQRKVNAYCTILTNGSNGLYFMIFLDKVLCFKSMENPTEQGILFITICLGWKHFSRLTSAANRTMIWGMLCPSYSTYVGTDSTLWHYVWNWVTSWQQHYSEIQMPFLLQKPHKFIVYIPRERTHTQCRGLGWLPNTQLLRKTLETRSILIVIT